MNYKLKQIFTNVRVIILLVVLVLALITINPRPFAEGVKEFRERILADVRKEEREETRKKFMDEFLKKK